MASLSWGVLRKQLAKTQSKRVFLQSTDYNSNNSNYRTRSIGGAGGHRFTFLIPDNLITLNKISLICIPSAGAAGSGKDIDLFFSIAALGENKDNQTVNDTATIYNFTGKQDQITEIDLTPILSGNISAGDFFGLFVDHKGIGGSIDYLGILLNYE